MRRPSIAIAIVGAGRFGSALASYLIRARYDITEIISRDTHSRKAQLDPDLVWFCVPDAEIARAAANLPDLEWKGKIAFHSSGVLSSDILQALRKQGAAVASVHPLMTFVRGSVPDLTGVSFAIEGDAQAVRVAFRVVKDLGGDPVRIPKRNKVAYHAFATMICPFLVALLASAEEIAALAKLSNKNSRHRMMPIIKQTLANYATLGPAKSFSGPIVRGDVETVDRHLKALAKAPAAQRAYIGLLESALAYLPNRNRRKIAGLLRKSARE